MAIFGTREIPTTAWMVPISALSIHEHIHTASHLDSQRLSVRRKPAGRNPPSVDLAGHLATHVGDASGTPSQMADYRLPAGTWTMLALMQFSIVAAASDYWRK